MVETSIRLSNDLEIVLRRIDDEILIEVMDGMNILGDAVVSTDSLRAQLVATVLSIE